MRTCGTVRTSLALLSKYMGPTPEVTQEHQTREYSEVRVVVKKYMESFAIWANLLNESNQRLPSDHYCPEGETLYMDMNQDLAEVVIPKSNDRKKCILN